MGDNFTVKRFIKYLYDTDRTKKFVLVKSFLSSDSVTLLNGIKKINGLNLKFTDDGYIMTYDMNSNIINNFSFGLIKTPTLLGSKLSITQTKSSQNFYYSLPHGNWILHNSSDTSPNFRLFYNPIPRSEFVSYYTNNYTTNEAYNTIAQYCQDINGLDPVCKCINLENTDGSTTEKWQFCMNDIFSGNSNRARLKILDPTAYGVLQSQCDCFNSNCDRTHPINIVTRKKLGACQSINIQMCNTNIVAGGNINADDIAVGCSIGPDLCKNVTCKFGTCIKGICVCPSGYSGTYCEIAPDKACDNINCQNGASCNGGACNCISGYSGTYCEVPPNDGTCNTIACLNNGECFEGVCTCPSGFSGTYCEIINTSSSKKIYIIILIIIVVIILLGLGAYFFFFKD
jgi:hypothetical protein